MKTSTKIPTTPYSLEVAEDLLKTYRSPLYVYHEPTLRHTIQQITQAISYAHAQFYFASVTNGNIALLKIFRQENWGIHANTPGDIYLGLKAGFNPQQIIYSGSNLNREEMQQLIRWGIATINLDSISQLQQFCDVYKSLSQYLPKDCPKPNLGMRLNLPELTGESRIGIRPTEFKDSINIANSARLKIKGLHFYRGTGTNATSAFTEAIDRVIETAKMLPCWEFLDFGGGFGYPYQSGGIAFDWQLFGKELTQKLESLERDIQLLIEPGRSAIARCGTLLTKVVSIKWQDNKQIVGVDTTIANLSVLAVHGGYREIICWKEIAETYQTDVCGNTTYSRDYLGKNCQLPALQIGDILAILDVGAYGYAMSSHFLHRPLPAEVLIEEKKYRLIRRREDYRVLLNNQVADRL